MKQQNKRFWVALIAFVFCAVVPAEAGRLNLDTGVCVDLADTLDPYRSWIPVGCELVDCCPGCPGNVIDWRIRVSGDALESVVLQFDNLSPAAARKLKIKGVARWEGTSLRVGPGETIVSGFKYQARVAPPVASPRLFANKDALRGFREAAGDDAARRPLGRMEVVVEQLLGKYVINEARLAYNLRVCPRRPVNTDRILLNGNFSTDNVVALLDARGGSGVCVDDEDYRGNQLISLGDIKSNGACNSELAIFSDDNAMLFVTPVNSWTDLGLDTFIALQEPMLHAPVSVWIADPLSGVQEGSEWDIANANLLYNSNNGGIAFDATYSNVSGNASARTTIGTACGVANVNRIKASNFFTAGRLNVYYVNGSFTGVNCFFQDPNIMFIGRVSNNQTLAHEIGHAFSLDHTNPLPGFGTNNVMQGGGAGRTHFSEGQSFRMNLNDISMINVNGVRNGPVRSPACADTTTSNLCPALALDVNPK